MDQWRRISHHTKISVDIASQWDWNIDETTYVMELKKQKEKYTGKILKDTLDFKMNKLNIEGKFINWQIQWDSTRTVQQFVGHILGDRMEGVEYGSNMKWEAIKKEHIKEEISPIEKELLSDLNVVYPEGFVGWDSHPIMENNILIQNATIWTVSDLGTIEGDILFANGKIKEIGENLKIPNNAIIINGLGKHVTPGLIDCHSHSAAFSINEGTQSVTSEVRIQDVINSDDIAIYRELAGGLTIANILHGSANTIGGQSAVIKLRWGALPSEMLYEKAAKGIKFALGENVKQSNWGDDNVTRYPQTRMGVEQILRDSFIRAQKYQANWLDYNANPKKWKKKISPRKDLELEALVEILIGDRYIHCHSYRQDEILMLTRVAEDFGFTIGTFQHVLEGYKVADRLKEHGANASTFSDWWAYKYEVIDAIPHNGALMTDMGVNVSFNSDSNELARRMNTEAAKGIKYGNLTEEEALKLVTINPAIQLGIDKWVGSLEKGKDADFVIWNAHPLSTKAVCQETWIDGIQYFSIKKDLELRNRDKKIRNHLINKILDNQNNAKTNQWKHKEPKSADHHHCIGKP